MENLLEQVRESKEITYIGKPLLFLIAGRAGTGKSTTANFFLEWAEHLDFLDYQKFSFAQQVKTVATQAFGWNGIKDAKGRELLQNIGNTGRKYNEDIWVEQTYQRMTDVVIPSLCVIDDWRFPNEFNYLLLTNQFYIVTVRLEAPTRESLKGTTRYNDISETSLQPNMYNYVITNEESLSKLKTEVGSILSRTLLERQKLYI